MAEHPHKKHSKVTLEQLIQLKRSERPQASFWDDFERDLHRRQLAALVTVEPWHRRAVRLLATVARRLAPVGASAAAVAFAVIALHRADVTPSNPADTAEAMAANDPENKVVMLPEEAISVSRISAPAIRPRAEVVEFRGSVRSAPQELASSLAAARRFVTVAAPVTFASDNDASAIYAANALTAGAVLRTLASATPESL
jgi:hypothetical protein